MAITTFIFAFNHNETQAQVGSATPHSLPKSLEEDTNPKINSKNRTPTEFIKNDPIELEDSEGSYSLDDPNLYEIDHSKRNDLRAISEIYNKLKN